MYSPIQTSFFSHPTCQSPIHNSRYNSSVPLFIQITVIQPVKVQVQFIHTCINHNSRYSIFIHIVHLFCVDPFIRSIYSFIYLSIYSFRGSLIVRQEQQRDQQTPTSEIKNLNQVGIFFMYSQNFTICYSHFFLSIFVSIQL